MPNNIYPYGLNSSVSEGSDNRYRFGCKELEVRDGLNAYDFHARTYYPDLGRFWQPDPCAHDYHGISPYTYCAGDPINRFDPDGKIIVFADSTTTEFLPAFYHASAYLREKKVETQCYWH